MFEIGDAGSRTLTIGMKSKKRQDGNLLFGNKILKHDEN